MGTLELHTWNATTADLAHPDRFVLDLDYLRNGAGATTVCAYSLRAREGLPVSVPVSFEELATLRNAQAWTPRTLHKRLDDLGEDPWRDLPGARQRLTVAMRRKLDLA